MLGYKPNSHGYDNFSSNDQETKTKILLIVDNLFTNRLSS